MTVARRGAGVGARWLRDHTRVVCGLLVEVDGSAPLPSGAAMMINERGGIEGSITGGCVESAVVEEAAAVLRGAPPHLVTYGISDELAGTVGLSCGGTVHVFVHELLGADREVQAAALDAAEDGRPVAVATLLDGKRAGAKLALLDGATIGSLRAGELLDHSVGRDAAALLAQGVSTVRRYGADGATLGSELRVHIRSFAPPPQMLIFGAIDFSAALARIAKGVGYVVTVCDPRQPFVGSARFEREAHVVVGWPQQALAGRRLGPRDAVLIFSHDPKLDVPAILAALETDAGYIGALGSRKTTADRARRLRCAGASQDQLDRLRAPCGLDIGGGTPEEVAISVLAEIVAVRAGRAGAPLCETAGAIHSGEEADSRRAGLPIVPAIVVLAAGEGSRYGRPKQTDPIGGSPMLLRVLDALDGFGDPQIVVLGAHADQVRPIVPGDRWQAVDADGWQAGPGASLRAGLAAAPHAEAALIVLGDLPWLQAEAIQRVLDAAAAGRAEAVRAFDGAVPGHPLLLRGRLLERAREAPDPGMAALLHEVAVMQVRCDGLGVAQDVDVPPGA